MAVAVARVSTAAVANGNATVFTSFATLPAAGSDIVATGAYYHNTAGGFSAGVSDNQGGTTGSYSQSAYKVQAEGSESENALIRFRENISSPSGTFTVQFDGGGFVTYWAVGAIEVTGLATTPLDVTATNGAVGGTASVSPTSGTTATTAVADSIAVAVVGVNSASTADMATPSGYSTIFNSANGAVSEVGNGAYKILAATGAQSASWPTITAGGSPNTWAAAIAVYKGTGGGGGPTIDTQPASQQVMEYTAATFSVSATTSGGALTYQWQDDSGGSFANISGATSSWLTVYPPPTFTGRRYRVNVTDSNGTTTSSAATLTVVRYPYVEDTRRKPRTGGTASGFDAKEWWG